ncbi:phospholipase A1 PLIP1, chloroplastic [Elaeis guineensis]|uniref:Phospholipase A1 PLIP1, chloroplastic n=1 Tax=Elaeis guineensis var. tenera TaxID=51953 RepID=A0A6I9QR81_ELAGV|nr:phospholipase A1 PLIP1, chloroplastic [Elaeis guineensis]XP_010913787.1 phospholipase A1 PLIP1, chloroplastic [Elaeis guineensis]XP_010913794.1 phospholipase A1 PLIP1, chloroplastic [Elaeis guineensis]
MPCAAAAIIHGGSSAASAVAKDHLHGRQDGIRRSLSGTDLVGVRRSRSEPLLRCSLSIPRPATAASAPAKLKTSRSVGLFSFIPNSIRSFLFNSEEAHGGMRFVDPEESSEEEVGSETEKRSNWVERIWELRSRWRDRKPKADEEDASDGGGEESDEFCRVSYDSGEEAEREEERSEWDRESFERLLAPVSWTDAKLFSQLAFLCNMAYVIPEIKAEDLRKYYDLRYVTSSLEKKSEAAIKARLESDSTRPPPGPTGPCPRSDSETQRRPLIRPSVAYEIAASAASYIHSRARGLLSLGGEPGSTNGMERLGERPEEAVSPQETLGQETTGEGLEEAQSLKGSPGRMYKSNVAAFVARSTMTAVVAAEDEARQEAAKDLRSLHSSPCEWFVCDDPSTGTRCFVIQGSDSLASWQANLFFEPTKFEETEVLVHRGIYEAAKGIYEQFMPEIEVHLQRWGDMAKLRFTGHSLGGSLSLLVHLMLLSRGAVKPSTLLPVVTFGSPSVFCRGKRVLEGLGLDEGQVHSVMMHRDIVPRAFSCGYPNHVAQVLKRLNKAFRSHPCLNNEKVLYSPLGQTYILQPDDKSSPPHPLLPPGAALYILDGKKAAERGETKKATVAGALRAFLNSPHPLETLSDPAAYGSDGTILRDHDSSNYLKAMNGLVREHTKSVVRRTRRQRFYQLWPLLATPTNRLTGGHHSRMEKSEPVNQEVLTTSV